MRMNVSELLCHADILINCLIWRVVRLCLLELRRLMGRPSNLQMMDTGMWSTYKIMIDMESP
jgi:hypothetical protein